MIHAGSANAVGNSLSAASRRHCTRRSESSESSIQRESVIASSLGLTPDPAPSQASFWQGMAPIVSPEMPFNAGSIARLREILRQNPVAIPACGALALFVIWASDEAGYPLTHWAPGGLILLALLAITLYALPLRAREVPPAVRVAMLCLALYAALSFLSILWAQVPGDAWEGADRTLVYLFVFSLFALWPQSGPSAALLLGAWTIAMVVLALFALLHVDAAAHPATLFSEGRLKYPADYENACAAVWCMVLWPALLLSASGRLPWALRGLFAAGTVLLADLALLSQSRGSLFATVVMLILVFALLPGRVRTFAVLVPVAIGVGVTAPTVLDVGDRVLHGGDVPAALHSATAAILVAAVLVGAMVAAGRPRSRVAVRSTRRPAAACTGRSARSQ